MLFVPASVGSFVVSKQGHDKGEIYVIVGAQTNGFALVANGKNRTLTAPKRKNARHLSITGTKVQGYEKLIVAEPVSANLKLAAAITVFRQKHEGVVVRS